MTSGMSQARFEPAQSRTFQISQSYNYFCLIFKIFGFGTVFTLHIMQTCNAIWNRKQC